MTTYPYVSQIADPPTRETVRLLWERMGALNGLLTQTAGTLDAGHQPILNVGPPQASGDALTKGYADTHYLSANASPSLVLAFFQSALGALLPFLLNHLTSQTTTETQILTGTLPIVDSLAAQEIIITPAQAGTLFYANDFDRWYRWDGTSWSEVGGAPERLQVQLWIYDPSVTPIPTGWAVVDAFTYTISTSSGTLSTASIANWQSSLLRAIHDAHFGESGGTLSPALATDGSLDTTLYAPGSTATTLPVSHNHTITLNYPASYTVVPIIRL